MSEVEKVQDLELLKDVKETWWITDPVLTASCVIVAQQFIHAEEFNPKNLKEFRERAVYIMRQHCPITYSYFFEHGGEDILPYGTVMIILRKVLDERPLFMAGAVDAPH